MKWRKIVKFGFIKETPKSSFDENTFKVLIVREVDDKLEIRYLHNMSTGGLSPEFINGLPELVHNSLVFGRYEQNLNWFERNF